jgi:hypothetical protein
VYALAAGAVGCGSDATVAPASEDAAADAASDARAPEAGDMVEAGRGPEAGSPDDGAGDVSVDAAAPDAVAPDAGPGADAGPATPQGLYESCAPSDPACLSRLDTMAGAGFTLVLNYQQEGGDAAQQIAYLDHAQSVGIKVIWSFSDAVWYDGTDLRGAFPALAAQCNCTDNAGFVSYVVGLVRGHPALWGYYVADEPPAAQKAAVDAFSMQVHALDPGHPRMIVGNADVTLLQPYADSAEDIGLDIYPIQDYPTSQQCIDAVGQLGAMGQSLAAQHGRRWSMVLQAFSWAQYPNDFTPCCGTRWPTRAEMRGMRDQALLSSPELLLWFSFFNVQTSDDPAGHWADLAAAALGP